MICNVLHNDNTTCLLLCALDTFKVRSVRHFEFLEVGSKADGKV